jgi:hypothetical protein
MAMKSVLMADYGTLHLNKSPVTIVFCTCTVQRINSVFQILGNPIFLSRDSQTEKAKQL